MFWRRSLVDKETADWVADGFCWLIQTLGPKVYFDDTRLILPTCEFFSSPGGDSHETAEAVFAEVKAHMGMEDWACRLHRQDVQPDGHVGLGLAVGNIALSPGGTFGSDGESIVVTYDPALMKTPVAFLNMLSHELSHYLLLEHVHDAPGGEEAHEIMTDLTAIYAGFGAIQLEGGLMRSAFTGALESGWQIGNLGYLSSETRAYALALFVLSKNIAQDMPRAWLSPEKERLYRRGLKVLERDPTRVEQVSTLRPE